MNIIQIIAVIYIAAYVLSFAVALVVDHMESIDAGDWMTGTILFHFVGGLAVGALIF